MKRRKFLYWLKRIVFKIPEVGICPKSFQVIRYILFPFDWLYERQSHVKYDVAYNKYTICGNEFTGEFFQACSSEIGKKFEVQKKPDGQVWITTIES